MRTLRTFQITLMSCLFTACPMLTTSAIAQGDGDTVRPSEETLPTPREIIDRFIEATGGKEAYRKHKFRTARGAFEMPAMGMKGPMLVKQSTPNLMLVNISLPGIGEMKQGFNGTVGWSIDPMSGPQLMAGKQLEQMKREADFFNSVDILKNFKESRTVARTDFNGEMCYQIKLTSEDGVTNAYYSVESGLAKGSRTVASTPQGDIPTTTMLLEYKDFGGVLVPTRTSVEMLGQQQMIVIEDITFDEIPESEFALPAAIKTLSEADAAKTEEKDATEGDDGKSDS